MDRYKGYRFPKAIIGFAVGYYYRYKLSLRDVSKVMLDRSIEVTYETIRLVVQTWGTFYAKLLRKHRASGYTDKWHVEEMRVLIKGEVVGLWRLIDNEGEEIEVLLQKRRNAKAAIRFLRTPYRNLVVVENNSLRIESN